MKMFDAKEHVALRKIREKRRNARPIQEIIWLLAPGTKLIMREGQRDRTTN